jgi:hypothetical protein
MLEPSNLRRPRRMLDASSSDIFAALQSCPYHRQISDQLVMWQVSISGERDSDFALLLTHCCNEYA